VLLLFNGLFCEQDKAMRVYLFIPTLIFTHVAFAGQILNGGFEADPNVPLYWQADPNGYPPEILTVFSAQDYGSRNSNVVLTPYEGKQFLLIQSGENYGEPYYGQLTQSISLNAGQEITGAYFFATSDYVPWYDWGEITLIPEDPCSNLAQINLVHVSVSDVGDFNSMPGWATFSHIIEPNEAGTYNLVLFVSNYGDHNLASFFAVDGLRIICNNFAQGDINGDCKVDLYDFALLAAQWMNICDHISWCNNTDINHTGAVDFADLSIMAANWLTDFSAF
jgi:hypothetical protein